MIQSVIVLEVTIAHSAFDGLHTAPMLTSLEHGNLVALLTERFQPMSDGAKVTS